MATAHTAPLRVLLIEDNEEDYGITRALLGAIPGRGYELEWAPSQAEGRARIARCAHDVYLVDYLLGDGRGIDLVREAVAAGNRAPFLMLTGLQSPDVDLEAMTAGVADYLVKGELSPAVLERAIRYAVGHAHTLEVLRKSEERLAATLGEVARNRDDLVSILDQLRIGVAMTDPSGRITYLSQTGLGLLGIGAGEALGKEWQDVLRFSPSDAVPAQALRPPAERERQRVELETKSQKPCWVEVELHDDPRDRERKIFCFYDKTEVTSLRRLLDSHAPFHEIVGSSAPMEHLFEQIRDVAGLDTTVFIDGETGSGKELVARAIHERSARRTGAFVAVNCASLTESLVASQLFGHKRGAFTGALESREGLFEAANGGTLFLDEIGDVPMSTQTTLLRVLQEREITRVGETQPRKIDVRLVTATHQDLARLVERGRFREDLLYRIRVVRVVVPPLRARREDIPLLVATFLERLRVSTGKPVETVAPEAMDVLLGHAWPGNVRELQSAIEYAVIHCKGTAVQPQDLPPEISPGSIPVPPRLAPRADQDERQRILDALRLSRGSRAAAARLLGISRATFYRRLTELNITLAPHQDASQSSTGDQPGDPAEEGA